MYDIIQMTMPANIDFSLDLNKQEKSFEESVDQYYTEAVFKDGKQKLEPLEKIVEALKNKLEEQIKEQAANANDRKKAFDPKAFWKDQLWKDFEDEIMKIFGFRNVSVNPYREKYNSRTGEFESKELNAFVYNDRRFPVTGLVTDKGFYDHSKSLRMEIYISLGLLRALDAKEIIAVALHEFGHSIDPALTDIRYTETNILSKYLTDREGKLTNEETKLVKDLRFGSKLSLFRLAVVAKFKNGLFGGIFDSAEKAGEKKLAKFKELLKKENQEFKRQTFSEAYADNFARMYGYGAPLMTGLRKIDKHYDEKINSRFEREKIRQDVIIGMATSALKDVHKTDIHRCKSLIKEYQMDIDDPNTPAKVKEQLQTDLDELKKIMDSYFNSFSEFQNKVNKLIADSLNELEKSNNEKKDK